MSLPERIVVTFNVGGRSGTAGFKEWTCPSDKDRSSLATGRNTDSVHQSHPRGQAKGEKADVFSRRSLDQLTRPFGTDADVLCVQEAGCQTFINRLRARLSSLSKLHHCVSKPEGKGGSGFLATFSSFEMRVVKDLPPVREILADGDLAVHTQGYVQEVLDRRVLVTTGGPGVLICNIHYHTRKPSHWESTLAAVFEGLCQYLDKVSRQRKEGTLLLGDMNLCRQNLFAGSLTREYAIRRPAFSGPLRWKGDTEGKRLDWSLRFGDKTITEDVPITRPRLALRRLFSRTKEWSTRARWDEDVFVAHNFSDHDPVATVLPCAEIS